MVLLAFAGTALIACSGGGDGGDEDSPIGGEIQIGPTAPQGRFASTGQVEQSRLNTAVKSASPRFQQLLSQIPSTVDNRRQVWVNDFLPIWDAWESLGASRPTSDSGIGAMEQFYADLGTTRSGTNLFSRPRMPSPRISGFDIAGALTNSYAALGFDQRNIDGSAMAGPTVQPLEVVVGDLDSSAIIATLGECATCRDHVVVEYDGTTFYSWGLELIGDLNDRFAPPMYDHAGRGGRLLFRDGIAMRTLTDDRMKSFIDVSNGTIPSLLDEPDFELAAAAHAIAGTYAAWFSDTPFEINDAAAISASLSSVPVAQAISKLRETEPLEEFNLISIGWGVDTGTAYATIVIINPDEPTAERNAQKLATRITSGSQVSGEGTWASLVDEIEIGTSGRAVIARLLPHPDQGLFSVDHLDIAYGLAVYE